MMPNDSIFALSSGAGRAGIAVLRLSGPLAGPTIQAMTGSEVAPRRASLRRISNPQSGELLDQGVIVFFPGPGSVTGEDVAELHVHGGPAVVAAVLGALRGLPGLRPAEAGEFTLRAFRNGRLDLVQAEGLADLLTAETELQRRQATKQTGGVASSIYAGWREELVGLLARVEAAVDFIDEEDVARATLADIRPRSEALADLMSAALARWRHGEMLRQGVHVVLLGLPNTGKSSLLNALAQREVAIVSEIAGTTRDVIEVRLDLGGVPVILSDTAGLRPSSGDAIERIGMERAQAAAGQADIIVWVSAPDIAQSTTVFPGVRPDLLVWNKADLAPVQDGYVGCSTRDDRGQDAVIRSLTGLAAARCGDGDQAIVVRQRQAHALEDSIRWLNESTRHGTDELELVAEDLRRAAQALGRLTGAIDVEDLLDAIFSRFCIGK